MANTIKFRRGLKASIPTLADGEAGWCLDTNQLYIGNNGVNKLVGEQDFLKLSGGTLTGFLTLHANPTSPLHSATKQYVDNVASGLDIKESVKCLASNPLEATYDSENLQLIFSYAGLVTIDGVDLDTVGMRVLVNCQADETQNGIYYVKTVGNLSVACVLQRALDFRKDYVSNGAFTFVEYGNIWSKTGWVLVTDDDDVVIDITPIKFYQFSGIGAMSFLGLSDTPESYNEQNNKLLIVNDTASGIEFIDRDSVGRTKFIALDDTPNDYVDGRILVSGVDGIIYKSNKVIGGLFADMPDSVVEGDTLVSNDEGVMVATPFKLNSLTDVTSTIGEPNTLLGVNDLGNVHVYIGIDDSPVLLSRNPIDSNWAYNHENANTLVHGVPEGSVLLHSSSIIDGGSF